MNQPRLWRNIKNGTIYTAISFDVKHSETLEPLVVYMSNNEQVWVRPSSLFFAKFESQEVPQ